jgi:hypothetical protein
MTATVNVAKPIECLTEDSPLHWNHATRSRGGERLTDGGYCMLQGHLCEELLGEVQGIIAVRHGSWFLAGNGRGAGPPSKFRIADSSMGERCSLAASAYPLQDVTIAKQLPADIY